MCFGFVGVHLKDHLVKFEIWNYQFAKKSQILVLCAWSVTIMRNHNLVLCTLIGCVRGDKVLTSDTWMCTRQLELVFVCLLGVQFWKWGNINLKKWFTFIILVQIVSLSRCGSPWPLLLLACCPCVWIARLSLACARLRCICRSSFSRLNLARWSSLSVRLFARCPRDVPSSWQCFDDCLCCSVGQCWSLKAGWQSGTLRLITRWNTRSQLIELNCFNWIV